MNPDHIYSGARRLSLKPFSLESFYKTLSFLIRKFLLCWFAAFVGTLAVSVLYPIEH